MLSRRRLPGSVDGIQPRQFFSERGDDCLDPLAHGRDGLIDIVQVGQQLAREEGVVGPKAPASAWRSAGSLARSVPRASSAKTWASVLAAWDLLHMGGVDQETREGLLEDVSGFNGNNAGCRQLLRQIFAGSLYQFTRRSRASGARRA
jgi:hypothetical protein